MKNSRGFSMLEALIAMLIIMIAILGIAGMQMYAINNTENARYQSIAAILATSMGAEMQANAEYWATPVYVTVNGATITGITSSGNICTSSGSGACSATQLAYYDLSQWGTAVANALPAGTATVNCVAVTPTTCTVTLTWSEKNIAFNKATGTETGTLASGTVNSNYTYQTLVSIE